MLEISKGTLIAGRYELVRPLARGAMGAVWVARHRHLDSSVAIKFMAASFAASVEARARFEREAKAAAQIRSIHIVPVVDYGIEDDAPFLVMELLHGEDLKTRLTRVERLPLDETVEVVTQVARAIRRAHEAGVIHRDLKPANVFISQNDEVEIYRVVDFGIAKAVGIGPTTNPTQTGQVLGSPAYMSPEQARGEKAVDARTDLWSLAVIAYRCLTGKLPFSGSNTPSMLVSITQDVARPPSTLSPDLPRALDLFFQRALAKSPDERFPSAAALAAAFAEAAGVRPRGRDTAGSLPELSAPVAASAVLHAPPSLRGQKHTAPMAAVPEPAASTTVAVGRPARRKVGTLVMSPEARAASASPCADAGVSSAQRADDADTRATVPMPPAQQTRTDATFLDAPSSQSLPTLLKAAPRTGAPGQPETSPATEESSTLPTRTAAASDVSVQGPSSQSVSTLPVRAAGAPHAPVASASEDAVPIPSSRMAFIPDAPTGGPSSQSVSTLPVRAAGTPMARAAYAEAAAINHRPTVPVASARAVTPIRHEQVRASQPSDARRTPPPSAMAVAGGRPAARPSTSGTPSRSRWLTGGMLVIIAVLCAIAILKWTQRRTAGDPIVVAGASGRTLQDPPSAPPPSPSMRAPVEPASAAASSEPPPAVRPKPAAPPPAPPTPPQPITITPVPPTLPPARNPHRAFSTDN